MATAAPKTKTPPPPEPPKKWQAVAKAALVARMRAERAALLRLRSVLREEHDSLIARLATAPEDAPRKAADSAVGLVSTRLRSMSLALDGAVRAGRLDAKKASLAIFQREWALVQTEVAQAGYELPLGVALHLGLDGPEDEPRSHMAGGALASAWAHLVIASIYRWTSSPKGSLAKAAASAASSMEPRLLRTAATETGVAYQDARDDLLEDVLDKNHGAVWLPLLQKRWDATLDKGTCATCRELDGEQVFWGLYFPGGEKPGYVHANCFPAGTMVRIPGGEKPIEDLVVGDLVVGGLTGRQRRVTALHRSHFNGDLIQLTAGDTTLSATPNHPVLTGRGWLDAGEVQLTDQLFRYKGQLRASPNVVAGEAHDAPASSREGFVLPGIDSHLPRRLMPMAGVDLDRQHAVRKGEVEVERAERELWHRRQAEATESGLEDAFKVGEAGGPLFRESAPRASLGGLLQPANRGVGSFRETGPTLWPLAPHSDLVRLGRGASAESRSVHGVVDHQTRAAEHFRDCEHGHLFVPMHPTQHFGIEIPNALSASAHGSGLVAAALPVHSCGRRAFRGIVFNLSVEIDESYVANGLVVHNCRCVETTVLYPVPVRERAAVVSEQDDGLDDEEAA